MKLHASKVHAVGRWRFRFAFRLASFLIGYERDFLTEGHVLMFGPFAVRFWRNQ